MWMIFFSSDFKFSNVCYDDVSQIIIFSNVSIEINSKSDMDDGQKKNLKIYYNKSIPIIYLCIIKQGLRKALMLCRIVIGGYTHNSSTWLQEWLQTYAIFILGRKLGWVVEFRIIKVGS